MEELSNWCGLSRHVEAGIASLYLAHLAHLAQWYETEVFTLNGSFVESQSFVDFLENESQI